MRREMISVGLAISASLLPLTASAEPARQERFRVDALTNFSKTPKEVRDTLDSALMKDPSSASLNFLSGLVYDAQSTAGSEGRQLARVGYLTALRTDPTYWPANYQLGLLAMEDGDALSAQRLFVAAGFYAPDVSLVFYALARAAYCAGDTGNAALALARAMSLAAPEREDEFETAALVSAANNDATAANSWMERFEAATGRPLSRQLRDRVGQLLQPRVAPASSANLDTTRLIPSQQAPNGTVPATTRPRPKPGIAPGSGTGSTMPPAPGAPPVAPTPGASASATGAAVAGQPAPATASRRRMATVDVVIIRRKESRAMTSGINLMDALSLQFGSALINSQRSRTVDRLSDSVVADTVNTLNNVNLTVPTVTYSLNIANAGGNKSSIDARPTLLVYDGQPAKIFTGGTLTYAASGQLSSQSYTKEVGISLNVTPRFNDDNTVTLTIATGLETFVNNQAAGSFREAVQTDKSSTEITADLRFGDTVIVSGGRYNNYQFSQSGTPLLGNIPVLGQLFNERMKSFEANDLLVILSLRRETGASESGSEEEAKRVVLLGDRLWRKLGAVPPDHTQHIEPDPAYSSFILENPGRGFNKRYIKLIGLDDIFIN